MLRTDNVTMRFGGLTAVDEFTVKVNKNEIVGLIGPNGAGKTTAFNMITGVYTPTKGRIYFEESDITDLKPHSITERGIARTFQNIRLFREMTVFENVLLACHLRIRASLFEATLHLPGYLRRDRAAREFAWNLLEAVGLEGAAQELATSLPYGKQRRLEIARALATRPKMLLLDEPAAGMNPQESRDLMEFIVKVRDEYDLTILLIEHHMQVVMGICTRMYVLDYGLTIAHGTPAQIRTDPKVIEAYLGVD